VGALSQVTKRQRRAHEAALRAARDKALAAKATLEQAQISWSVASDEWNDTAQAAEEFTANTRRSIDTHESQAARDARLEWGGFTAIAIGGPIDATAAVETVAAFEALPEEW